MVVRSLSVQIHHAGLMATPRGPMAAPYRSPVQRRPDCVIAQPAASASGSRRLSLRSLLRVFDGFMGPGPEGMSEYPELSGNPLPGKPGRLNRILDLGPEDTAPNSELI
jgi:hypothetical protein